jgi:hypothetical protein
MFDYNTARKLACHTRMLPICTSQNCVQFACRLPNLNYFFIYVANDVLVRAAMKSAARCGKALRIALFSESIEASTCIVQPVSSGCSHDSVPGNSLLAAIPVQSLRGCGSIHVCVSAVCTLTYRCSMTQLHLFRVALVSMCGLVLAMRNPLACRL